MRCQKPEIVLLAPAQELILGDKIGLSEAVQIFIPRAFLDSEL